MVDAQKVFDAMKNSSLVQWNALITGYAHQGQIDHAFHCLHEMMSKGVQPDEVTFVNILFICSHGGLVEKGRLYFKAMITEYGIDPTIRHLGCIVDLLGRVGQLDEAMFVLDKVEEPDLVAWNSVLGASQKLGNVQICEQAFESTLQLNEQDPTSFIMMSNMYANFAFSE
jgi:pentatricopeptide repeat protein